MSDTIVFEAPSQSALSRRRGRPEKFTAEIRDALAAQPGQFAVVQTGIRSMSRVSVLKAKYPGFEFVGEKTAEGEVKVFARVPAPVEPEPVPAPAAKRVRPSRAKAAVAARAAATEV